MFNTTYAEAALLVYKREDLEFDEYLSDQRDQKYAEPQKVLVTQVKTNIDSLTYDSERWVQSLYYYMITRMGFADIPYNYLIDRQGKIYQGRSGYQGVVPELKSQEGAILIGYLSNGSDLTMLAQDSLLKLLEEQAGRFYIEKEDVEVVQLSKVAGKFEDKNQKSIELAKLEYTTVSNAFSSNIDTLVNEINWTSGTNIAEYKGEIIEVDYPNKIKVGESFDVKVKLKNKNNFVWFTDTEYIYVTTKDDTESPFFLNESWDSESKPYSIEGESILPGQEFAFTFKSNTPYETGTMREEFILWNSPEGSKVINGTAFTVDIIVQKGDARIIQITDTGVDWINVRECASRGCEKLDQLDVGGYAEVLGEDGSWFKIRYGDDREGWIVNSYYREVE